MIYKYVSIYTVIEKLYRDYSTQRELDVWDVVEWAGEAMDFIGAYSQYNRVPNYKLTVANYKAKLPCDFVHIEGVKYNGVPLLYATSINGPTIPDDTTDIPPNTLNRTDVDSTNFPMLGHANHTAAFPMTYIIQNGYLHTELEAGDLVMSYTGLMVDKDGFPMIPDMASYKAAVAAYVQMVLDRTEWRAQRAPEGHYRDSERQWIKFVRQARGEANMPSLDKMEGIKRMWLRLRPNIHAHNSGFGSGISPNARTR